MKGKKKKKKTYQTVLNDHAKKRALERYNIKLTNRDLELMIEKIQVGDALFMKGYTNTRTVHKILYKDIEFLTLYSRNMKRIVTFLPEEANDVC